MSLSLAVKLQNLLKKQILSSNIDELRNLLGNPVVYKHFQICVRIDMWSI